MTDRGDSLPRAVVCDDRAEMRRAVTQLAVACGFAVEGVVDSFQTLRELLGRARPDVVGPAAPTLGRLLPTRPPHERERPLPAAERAVELGLAAAQAAADKLATDILLLDVSEQLVITDVFLLASAPNDRQVKAVVDEIEDRLRELGAKPVRREGAQEGRWVLLDFAEIVVHVQHEEERVFYALERLWKDCPAIPFIDRDAERAAGRKTS